MDMLKNRDIHVLCCFALLFVCLFDLACFFLPSFSSLIKTCTVYLSVLCDIEDARHLGGVRSISLHVPLCHGLHHQTLDLRRHTLWEGWIGGEVERRENVKKHSTSTLHVEV